MIQLNKRAATNLEAIRNQKPLIHNITNYVVMNTTVNALLCVGASSVMTHAVNEVEEMAGFHHCRTGLLSRWSDGDACALPPQGD